MSATRRQLLARGATAAGTAALPPLIAATPALAQATDETDALEPVVELEQAAELAYSLAAGELSGPAAELLRRLGTHAGEHATALGEALDQLGVDPPEASEDPANYDALDDFDPKATEKQTLDFFTGLEEELITAYEGLTSELESATLAMTGAQVGAAHGQAWAALRLESGAADGAIAVSALPDPVE